MTREELWQKETTRLIHRGQQFYSTRDTLSHLDHAPEECVDLLLTISVVAAVYVVVVLLAPASERGMGH